MAAPVYLCLLGAVAALRLGEISLSRRHQRRLGLRGVVKMPGGQLAGMVLVNAGVLAGAAVEVVLLERPWLPALGLPMLALFGLALALRWWAIVALAEHWNIEVMASMSLGVVTRGPYRFVRHPNYVALFLELLALPLVHTAWLTALVGSVVHAVVLHRRVGVEERVLVADPQYRAAMAAKPRFLPWRW